MIDKVENIKHGCDNKNNSIIVDMVDDNDENLLKKLMGVDDNKNQ